MVWACRSFGKNGKCTSCLVTYLPLTKKLKYVTCKIPCNTRGTHEKCYRWYVISRHGISSLSASSHYLENLPEGSRGSVYPSCWRRSRLLIIHTVNNLGFIGNSADINNKWIILQLFFAFTKSLQKEIEYTAEVLTLRGASLAFSCTLDDSWPFTTQSQQEEAIKPREGTQIWIGEKNIYFWMLIFLLTFYRLSFPMTTFRSWIAHILNTSVYE